ncbi:unnamed protein product [Calicophoron daubneyi]|uniref:Eukaryotic translation initiation factor 4E transporter n=1 Tax=Calicophoron daubneyi TaxID=300641 RepID=A0AAV2T5G2_CALDB
MDAGDIPDSSQKLPRRRYGRSVILAYKKNAVTPDPDIYDNLLYPVGSAQRGSRRKPNSCSFSKSQNDRPRDSSNIVLGPQKRTWNIGCHVSQAAGRDAHEATSLANRGGKFVSEYRTSDRSYPRPVSEYKRDFRGSIHNVGRERGVSRRPDGVPFGRTHGRDERFGKDGRLTHGYEEEPEWFSEGPATVNETIELGEIIEDIPDEDRVSLPTSSAPQANLSGVPETGAGAAVPQRKTENTTEGEVTCSVPVSAQNECSTAKSLPQSDLLGCLQSAKSSESQGSRFKHLFSRPEGATGSSQNRDINERLLQLLKGSSGDANIPSPDKNNVLQVENKLRSILLGHEPARGVEFSRLKDPEPKNSKPKVLTVEEIEAQLNIPRENSVSKAEPDELPQEMKTFSITEGFNVPFPKAQSTATNLSNSQITGGSNLAPLLQSLALKQQQQMPCSHSVHLRNTLNPFGILNNPMVRLPTSTFRWLRAMANAVSASARINQLQQGDLSPGLGECGVQQGILRQIWENGGRGIIQTNSRGFTQNPNSTGSMPQRTIGGNIVSLSDLPSRSGYGFSTSHPLANPNSAMAPRRPIVKAQQGSVGNHNYQFLSPLGSSNSNTLPTHIMPPSIPQDLEHRLFDLPVKPQQFGLGTPPPGIGEKLSGSPMLFQNSNSDHRFSDTVPQNPSPPIFSAAPNNNNNSASLASRLRTIRPASQADSTFAFLSQLVEMDRSSGSLNYQKPSSLDPLLSSAIKAKTLEEIEHQEVASSGSFF